MKHHRHNPGFEFVVPPVEFTKQTEKELLQYCLGGVLYMPVLFDTEARLFQTLEKLAAEKIYPRRYFYPSLHDVRIFEKTGLSVAESVASRIACLPLYNELVEEDIRRICGRI